MHLSRKGINVDELISLLVAGEHKEKFVTTPRHYPDLGSVHITVFFQPPLGISG
jgi:hypothetical protein